MSLGDEIDVSPGARSVPRWPNFLWHSSVHQKRSRETLHFFQLAFAPCFDRDAVEAGIRSACHQNGVGSIFSYELLGTIDVMLRVWLPASVDPDKFSQDLDQELDSAGIVLKNAFEVTQCVRHFAFRGANGEHVEPPEEALEVTFSNQQLAQAEAYFIDGAVEHASLVTECVNKKLLCDFREHIPAQPDHGSQYPVKFFLSVRGEGGPGDVDAIRALGQRLCSILDDVQSGELSQPEKSNLPVGQISLYKGAGFAQYLILGRVDGAHFHEIHHRLVAPINSVSLRESFRVRTCTLISAQRGLQIADERLSFPEGEGRSVWLATSVRPDEPGLRAEVSGTSEQTGLVADRFKMPAEFLASEAVGSGGAGAVYRVWDTYSGTYRALKLFNDSHSMFREANSLRNCSHPGIVEYVFAGLDQKTKQAYVIMEFVDGWNLRQVLEGQADGAPVVDDRIALEVMKKVLEALAHIHPDQARIDRLRAKSDRSELSEKEADDYRHLLNAGVIHRDIKPENIMLTPDGDVKIVDFNIASPNKARTATQSGTPDYMAIDAGWDGWAPEDDIFACGVVLYELLGGSLPHRINQGVRDLEPIHLSDLRPDLPELLCGAVMKSCATYRADRFGSAQAMAEALTALEDA